MSNCNRVEKPLGIKTYGSIPHLPGSRVGPAEHTINDGQARMCLEKLPDKWHRVVIQEKYDGSCCAVAHLADGRLAPLQRAGYGCADSPHVQHHLFATWAAEREDYFRVLLAPGERCIGEWMALAHGTRYALPLGPFVAFDIMREHERVPTSQFVIRIGDGLPVPACVSNEGQPLGIEESLAALGSQGAQGAIDGVEGLVYRVERCQPKTDNWRVLFLAKWVRPDKDDGRYWPEITGLPPVWNWRS